jgi:hypothetical protein
MLAYIQLNIYKKIKVLKRPGINYIVDAEKGHIVTINLQNLFLLNYTQNYGCNLKQLIILLHRRQLDGINLVLSIDMVLSLMSLPNAP